MSSLGVSPLPPAVSLILAKTLPTAAASFSSSPMPPMCMNMMRGESHMKWLCRAVTSRPLSRATLITGLTWSSEHHVVAHDHAPVADPLEGGPAAQAHRHAHLHAGHGRRDVAARQADLEDALLFIERPFAPGQLLDPGCIRPGLLSVGPGCQQNRTTQAHCCRCGRFHGSNSFLIHSDECSLFLKACNAGHTPYDRSPKGGGRYVCRRFPTLRRWAQCSKTVVQQPVAGDFQPAKENDALGKAAWLSSRPAR